MGYGKIVAVSVTHNRPEQLILCLNRIRSQTVHLEALIVVDNASDAETVNLLKKENGLITLRVEPNAGGSGGFAAGIEEALRFKPDWIWLVEDDAVVESNTLENLLCKISDEDVNVQNPGLLCPAIEEDGRFALKHRRYFNPLTLGEKPVPLQKYAHLVVEIDTASFVGALINADAISRVGVPDARYFLFYDDTEYSLRLKQAGYKLYLVPASKVIHQRSSSSRLRKGPYGLRHYYNLRNRIIVYRKFGQTSAWRLLKPIVAGLILLIWVGRGKPKAVQIYLRALKDSRKEPFVAKADFFVHP